MAAEEVTIDYTNFRGERALRRIRPLRIEFKATEWHQDPQWILEAIDLDKEAVRSFAMDDIRTWIPVR